MGKNVIKVTESRGHAEYVKNAYNRDFKKRGIKRECYVSPVSQGYVRTLTRKGYPVAKKNYAVCVRDKR